MVTSCSAFGCTYRHKKGDNIGLYRFPAKDEKLCRRWVLAVRRVNWKPTPTSRICGKHFQTGKPSKDQNHPDYVPNVFSFNQNQTTKQHWQKVAEKKAFQRVQEILHGTPKLDMTGYRQLKPKPAGYGVPFVIRARKADKQQPVNPAVQSCHFSMVMKKNNTENRKEVEAFNSNGMFLNCKEMQPSVPEHIWVPNFDSGKNPNACVEKPNKVKINSGPVTFLKENFPASVYEPSIMIHEGSEPIRVESPATISDDSTLTADSSIPATEDTETPMAARENATSFNVIEVEHGSNDAFLNHVSSPVENSDTENTTDSDYSEFKSTPFDSMDILAIKLETMLAVNISLKQKVKFYQNRCKQYETEINNLTDIIKKLKLKDSVSHNN